jgi:hypothetical protein
MSAGEHQIPAGKEFVMVEPDEDLKEFEESLKKPRVSSVKKDRIVSCTACGRKQTMSQVAIGEDVKCKHCGATFTIKKEQAEDAHLVTMAAVDLQVKQMELMQRSGKRIAPRSEQKITVTSSAPQKQRSGGGGGGGKVILYIILLLVIIAAILAVLHFAEIVDLQPYIDKLTGGSSG